MKKESPIYLAIFLAIVAALAGGALSFANNLTQPVIQANADRAEKASLVEMFPGSNIDDFESVDASAITADDNTIVGIYKYEGDIVVFKCEVSGFDQGTTFLVAINASDNTIAAFKAIENGDTKGIGSKIMESAFANSLIGKDATGTLDTISGATLTSTPVVEAISRCAVYAAQVD